MTVARAGGRTLRDVALDPFAWTACAFLELDDLARLDRARAELAQIDAAALVAFSFNKPSELAARRDETNARHASAQARLLGSADPAHAASPRVNSMNSMLAVNSTEDFERRVAELEAQGYVWREVPVS